jgi:hypothetical protein
VALLKCRRTAAGLQVGLAGAVVGGASELDVLRAAAVVSVEGVLVVGGSLLLEHSHLALQVLDLQQALFVRLH